MAFDDLSTHATPVADWATSIATWAPEPTTVARVGLDAMVFATDVRKLLDPLSRSAYVVPQLVPALVVSPMTFALANGVLEVGFGTAIVADRYTTPTSAVATVSLPATCLCPAIVFVVEGGLFGDMLARDIGLAGLVWAVLIDSLRRPTRTP